ncbi:unnamed protein product, partial [Onchocerca ochengi]|uniref:Integrase catalytic domain-containing protein n=1 Tax=Onchocerca ochengi TaxID=42157 RepID=A0A182EY88_ONCOC
AASKVLRELNRTENETMEWELITPGTPLQGDIYERMFGVVQRSLRRAIGTKLLNNTELITLIAELEAIINGRPLVDIEEIGLVLRPKDFLHPGSACGEQLMEEKDYRRDNATANIENLQTKELTHQYTTTCKRLDHLRESMARGIFRRAKKTSSSEYSSCRIRREPEIDELVLLKQIVPEIFGKWKKYRDS